MITYCFFIHLWWTLKLILIYYSFYSKHPFSLKHTHHYFYSIQPLILAAISIILIQKLFALSKFLMFVHAEAIQLLDRILIQLPSFKLPSSQSLCRQLNMAYISYCSHLNFDRRIYFGHESSWWNLHRTGSRPSLACLCRKSRDHSFCWLLYCTLRIHSMLCRHL